MLYAQNAEPIKLSGIQIGTYIARNFDQLFQPHPTETRSYHRVWLVEVFVALRVGLLLRAPVLRKLRKEKEISLMDIGANRDQMFEQQTFQQTP